MGPPIQLDEEANCIHEKREALYYTALIHKHLDRAMDALSYWKEEAAYQRKALTDWVPSFKDCGDSSLRRGINQLGYWREESRYLNPISKRMMEKLRRDQDELRESEYLRGAQHHNSWLLSTKEATPRWHIRKRRHSSAMKKASLWTHLRCFR